MPLSLFQNFRWKKTKITGKGKICIYFKTNQPPAEGLIFWPFDLAWNKAFSALLLNQNGQFKKKHSGNYISTKSLGIDLSL